MYESLIRNYASKINKSDIYNYAYKYDITLTDKEIDIIYYEIKHNLNSWINNYNDELIKIKDKLESTTYLKIIELVNFYKSKYNIS